MRNALILSVAILATAGTDTPALFRAGKIPVLSVQSAEVGGGQVLLEVSVDRAGAVTGIKPLRVTTSFTERMTQAVKTWTFTPAEIEIPASRRKPGGPKTEPVETKVLVAGVFRQPSVIGATLGEPMSDVATNSPAIPFPLSVVTPTYPAGTMSPGVVLVEVKIDAAGGVTDAKIRIPAAGFDNPALRTARQWRFRPARTEAGNVPSVAYIVFGFPVPKG